MSRLFLGTFLAEEDKKRLDAVQKANHDLDGRWHCRARWVQPAKLHLTWLFLGNVEESRVAKLEEAVEQSRSIVEGPLELVYDHMEVWFARGLPRHLVLASAQLPEKLVKSIEHLRKHLIDFVAEDYKAQARDQIRPHVTLVRFHKLNDERPRLPLEAESSGDHPFAHKRKLRVKELPAHSINGMEKLLPIRHLLENVALIASNQEEGTHAYSIVKLFPLA
jgi:2'-5' RNA ligase